MSGWRALIDLAEEGNIGAANELILEASDCLLVNRPLPYDLRLWLSARLFEACSDPENAGRALRMKKGPGRPPEYSENFRDRLILQDLKDRAARVAAAALAGRIEIDGIPRQLPATLNRGGDQTAFEYAQEWMEAIIRSDPALCKFFPEPVSPETIQGWLKDLRKRHPSRSNP